MSPIRLTITSTVERIRETPEYARKRPNLVHVLQTAEAQSIAYAAMLREEYPTKVQPYKDMLADAEEETRAVQRMKARVMHGSADERRTVEQLVGDCIREVYATTA